MFDQIDPDAVDEATAAVAGDTDDQAAQFIGRSRALQQQYALMQFEIVEAPAPLNVGLPVTVIARSGAPVSGMFAAALGAGAGTQRADRRVRARRSPRYSCRSAVRTEPFDSQTVLVTGGLSAGREDRRRERARSMNQVR